MNRNVFANYLGISHGRVGESRQQRKQILLTDEVSTSLFIATSVMHNERGTRISITTIVFARRHKNVHKMTTRAKGFISERRFYNDRTLAILRTFPIHKLNHFVF